MNREDNRNIEDIRQSEKKFKRTSIGLGILSGALACAFVITLVFAVNPAVPGTNAGPNIASPKPKEESQALGIPGKAEFGNTHAARDYTEIYNYLMGAYEYYRDEEIIAYTTDAADMKLEIAAEESLSMPAVAPDVATNGAGGFSTTNVMTENVDESDISKTDGNFIYNATGSEVIIFDIREGEAQPFSTLVPEFKSSSDIIRQMYIDNDYMSLIVEHAIYKPIMESQTLVYVYDLKDRKVPELIGIYSQDGTYKTSRKVGDIIYLFTDNYLKKPKDKRETAVTLDGVKSWLPTINDTAISSDCIYLPEVGVNSLVVSSFNQKEPSNNIDVKMIVNDYAEIYVGAESIYLYYQTYAVNRDITNISNISYNKDGELQVKDATSVRGHINDSFAINENNGYLRVVTTEWDEKLNNMLYVLDSDLKECGRINNIAGGEQLYACRFMGDIGYFVTFKNTDPLFTVDLKDPKNPKIIGELELLGFSEYLHFWGEDKLLGIGYEAEEDGTRTGLKLSMFDIKDPSAVTEEGKLVLDGADYAPGFYNYKAILCDPRANYIGFAYCDYDYNDDNERRKVPAQESAWQYEIFSYNNGRFEKVLSESLKDGIAERTRGHYSRDYIYVSKDTEVSSHKR